MRQPPHSSFLLPLPHHLMTFLLLFVMLISSLPLFVSASFTLSDIMEVYELFIGTTDNCLSSLEITDDDLLLTYGDMLLNDKQCNRGMMRLFENGEAGPLTRKLLDIPDDFGGFLATTMEERIDCDGPFIDKDTFVVFFKPNNTVGLTMTEIFGREGATDLGDKWDPTTYVDLRGGVKYVLIGERCMFRERGGENKGKACFPGDAKVQTTISGTHQFLRNIQVGDQIRDHHDNHHKTPSYTKVLAFTHRHRTVVSDFLQFNLDTNTTLTLSPGHLLPVFSSSSVSMKRIMSANAVTTGMYLQSGLVSDRLVKVTHIRTVRKHGLYNPQTESGTLVLDGIVVTAYTTAIQENGYGAGHAAMSPIRALAKWTTPRSSLSESGSGSRLRLRIAAWVVDIVAEIGRKMMAK